MDSISRKIKSRGVWTEIWRETVSSYGRCTVPGVESKIHLDESALLNGSNSLIPRLYDSITPMIHFSSISHSTLVYSSCDSSSLASISMNTIGIDNDDDSSSPSQHPPVTATAKESSSSKNQYPCRHCGKSFSSSSNRCRHERQRHPSQLADSSRSTRMTCVFCSSVAENRPQPLGRGRPVPKAGRASGCPGVGPIIIN